MSKQIYWHGRRIVDVNYIIKEVLKFPHRKLYFCSNNDIKVSKEIINGLTSIFVLKCRKCNEILNINSEEPKSDLLDANLALVAGVISIGLGYTELKELCSSLHLPIMEYEQFLEAEENILEFYHRTASNLTEFPDISQSVFKSDDSGVSLDESNDDLLDKEKKFLKDLNKTPEEIVKLCKLTIKQSDDPIWYEERKKRLTASNFGLIYSMRDSTNRQNIVNNLLHSNFKGNCYTDYGKENEINALNALENILNKKIQPCGLFVHKDEPYLAASPDGLIDNDFIVEIKCPYTAQNHTPAEAIKRNLIKFANFDKNGLHLKRTHKYYYQVQGQLFVTDRKSCYFVIWTPKGLIYELINKDLQLWEKMLPKLNDFYFKHLLPNILNEI